MGWHRRNAARLRARQRRERAAIYLTSRGAESVVDGSVDDVEKRARAVFAAGSRVLGKIVNQK
jgi:hypothetical protein